MGEARGSIGGGWRSTFRLAFVGRVVDYFVVVRTHLTGDTGDLGDTGDTNPHSSLRRTTS